MSFSDILQAKIAARRLNGSSIRAAADALRQQAFERIRPVHEAVAEMTMRLAKDPVFAAGFGAAPKLSFKWSADTPTISTVAVEGPVGLFQVLIIHRARFLDRQPETVLKLQICPEGPLTKALGCSWLYAEATPVEGEINDISGFLVAAEDMLAEFLADVFLSPVAGKFLPDAV